MENEIRTSFSKRSRPIIAHDYIAFTLLIVHEFWPHRSAPSRKTLEVSMRESREARRLQRGASFIVAFPAVYRDSLANGKRHNGGHDGTKRGPCRYRGIVPRNVVRRGARVP